MKVLITIENLLRKKWEELRTKNEKFPGKKDQLCLNNRNSSRKIQTGKAKFLGKEREEPVV